MTPVLLALASSVCWGVGDFLGGLGARRMPTLTVLAVSELAGLVGIAAVVLARRDALPSFWPAGLAFAAGIAGVVGLGALYRGMAVGAMAVVAPISAASAMIPVAVGLARGERPSTLQLAGVAAVLAGVALVSREPAPARGRFASGLGLALLAAVGFGSYFVLIDEASADGALWAVLIARAVATALALVAAAALGSLRFPRRSVGLLVAVGVFDVTANGLLALALTKGLVSVVSVLASLYPVVVVLLAHFALGERIRRSQQLGVAGVLGGVALISAA